MESSVQVVFEFYGSTVIVYNSANAQILSEEYIFIENIEPIISNGVANIGGKYLIPKVIGPVSWSWTDDEGKLHTNKFNNVLYFPYSPVNILSSTLFYESMKDD